MWGCHVTVDDFVYVPGMQERGLVHYGKAYVRSKEDSAVLVHEGWHICQQRKKGIAKDYDEWQSNETDAKRMELKWRAKNE
jgi:hypothetical protein